MRKNDVTVFKEKEKLYQMLNLRRAGISLTTLGLIFGVDRKSIEYHCNKYKIRPMGVDVYTIERIVHKVLPPIPQQTYRIVNGERINIGKSYAEYLTP